MNKIRYWLIRLIVWKKPIMMNMKIEVGNKDIRLKQKNTLLIDNTFICEISKKV